MTSWNFLARPERLELPTYWFEASRSIQLSYGRATDIISVRPLLRVVLDNIEPRTVCATMPAVDNREGGLMFLILFVVLLVMWLLGFAAFHVAGGLIHLLLIIAVISLIAHFVRRTA